MRQRFLLEGQCFDDLSGERPPVAAKLFPRGGARRVRLQPSDTLTKSQCESVIRAAERAEEVGKRLNRFITLVWKLGGVVDVDAAGLTRAFIRLASEWMRGRAEPLCWVSVLEWGPVNGAHAHLLLHVPPELKDDFWPMPRRWATKLLPDGYRQGVVKSDRLAGADTPDDVSAVMYDYALRSKLRYMLKAADPAWEIELGLLGYGDAPWGQRSRVYGKRIGCWQERRSAG